MSRALFIAIIMTFYALVGGFYLGRAGGEPQGPYDTATLQGERAMTTGLAGVAAGALIGFLAGRLLWQKPIFKD